MLDNRQWKKVRREAERQGWRVEPTTNGFQLMSPNGEAIVTMDRLHKPSSPWALTHTVKNMRRHGFVWPPAKK